MTFASSLQRAVARLRPTRATTPETTPAPTLDDDAVEAAQATQTDDAAQATPAATSPRRFRALLPVATAVLALALVGGTTAVAQAHKTVELDVDGEITQLSTFSGSVGGVLEAQGVTLGSHDAVTPATGTSLSDGDVIVVRHGTQVSVVIDGTERTIWTTALAADEALATLAARGTDAHLVAGRSAAGGRPELPIQLATDGPVDVLADGATRTVEGVEDLDAALSAAEVTLGADDRVRVELADGRLTVVVQRVVTADEAVPTAIAFETVTEKTASLTTGVQRTSVAGVEGELSTTYRVVRVDGVEESREQLSQAVTREPVTKVVQVGTAPKPAVSAASSGAVVGGDVWAALAQCESGGNPGIVSSNGLYYGLYQFSLGTWQAMGGSGLPSNASAAEQTQRAQALQARSGWGQWPACSRKLGLL